MHNRRQNARTTLRNRKLMAARCVQGRPRSADSSRVRRVRADGSQSVAPVPGWRRGCAGEQAVRALAFRERPRKALARRRAASPPRFPDDGGGDRGPASPGPIDDRALAREGGRRSSGALEPVRRYQRGNTGEFLRLDIEKPGRLSRVGRITGDSRKQSDTRGVGLGFIHVAVDDAAPLVCVEDLPDEIRSSAVAVPIRATRWLGDRSARIGRAMSDNESWHVSKRFRKAVRRLGARHLRTRPYTPVTNGRTVRCILTLLREWADAILNATPDDRNADRSRRLDRCIQKYGRTQPSTPNYPCRP